MRQLKITLLILFVSSFYKLSAQTCKQEYNVVLGASGAVSIDAEWLLYAPVSGVEYTVSPDALACHNIHDTIPYTVTGSDGFTCSGYYIVKPGPPRVKTKYKILLSLNQYGEATISPKFVDHYSFGICSDLVSYELSQSYFNRDDIGEKKIYLIVRDTFGSTGIGATTIRIEDKLPPEVNIKDTVSLTLSYKDSWDFPVAEITVDDVKDPAVENAIHDNTGIKSMEFSKFRFGCEDLGYNDVTFKVTDFGGNAVEKNIVVQVLPSQEGYTNPPNCRGEASIFINLEGSRKVGVEHLLHDGNFDCEGSYTLKIEDVAGNVVADNILTWEGDTIYNYTIMHATDESTCWGQIKVTKGQYCGINEDDIQWPVSVLTVYQEEVDINKISPEDLLGQGYSKHQVQPIVDQECASVYISFTDASFQTGEGGYKVVRTFTVLDAYEGRFFEKTQIIKVRKTSNSVFICDTLDRTTPVGDCDSGHTLDDDVEWPADIRIADHRITPEGLVQVSGVDYRDARPQFYGDVADSYSATYVDLVGSLNDSTLTILRKWHVKTSRVSFLSWDFEQEITVDFSSFSDMVTVSDHDGYTLSGVTFADTYTTDEDGIAYVPSTVGLTPYKSDNNAVGVDVLDLVLTQHRILNLIQLDHNSSIRANSVVSTNQDPPAGINTRDLLQTTRMIHGRALNTYRFIDSTSTSQSLIKPRAHFVGYKLGDVDNSYRTGVTFEGEVGIAYDDILLNAGEAYDIPIYANHEMKGYGCQMRMAIDTHMLQVVGVVAEKEYQMHHSFDSEGHLLITKIINPSDQNIAEKQHFFTIKAVAKQNSLLNLVMKVVEDDKTFFVGDDYKRYHIKENVNDGIINKVKDIGNVSFIKTYPNPVSHSLYIDVTDSSIDNYTIHLFDASGSLRFTGANVASIAMDRYTAGAYILVLTTDSDVYRQRLIKY